MNPRIDPAIIAEAYEEDPESARAEYGAEFRDDLADFVTREIVDAVTAVGRTELPPDRGVAYSAFCDPSGGMSDSMTMAIGHLTAAGVAVLDFVHETRAPFDPEATVAMFAGAMRRYGVERVTGDRFGGEWIRHRFQEHGIEYEPSARPKSDLYLGLLPLLTTGRLELLDHPRLAAQLVGLERRTARSGKDSVDHTPGGHDDIANSVAGVLVGLDLDRRPALIRAESFLADGLPVPMPQKATGIMAVLIVALDGTTAATYFTHDKAACPPLFYRSVLVDFEVAPLTGNTLKSIVGRLLELSKQIFLREKYSVALFLPKQLMNQSRLMDLRAHEIPEDLFFDPPGLALAAAVNVASGRVKIAAPAAEKAKTHPLGGALNFRPGKVMDTDPLRLAALVSISLLLDDSRKIRVH